MERAITGGMDKGFFFFFSANVFNTSKAILIGKASKKRAEDKESEAPTHRGYYRSMYYHSPEEFYNHKSGSFSRNRRAQMKTAKKKR